MTAASRLGDVCSEVDTLFSDKAVLGLILPEGSRRWTSQDVFPGGAPRAYHVLPPALMRACWTPRARRISAMRSTAWRKSYGRVASSRLSLTRGAVRGTPSGLRRERRLGLSTSGILLAGSIQAPLCQRTAYPPPSKRLQVCSQLSFQVISSIPRLASH